MMDSHEHGRTEEIDIFLYKILLSSKLDGTLNDKKCEFVLRSEDSILKFLNSTSRVELEFPPLNSYYRRIIHRLGRKYNLAHRIEMTTIFNSESTLRKIYLTKLSVLSESESELNAGNVNVGANSTVLPALLKCSDWFSDAVSTTSTTDNNDNIFIMKKDKEASHKKRKDKDSTSKTGSSSGSSSGSTKVVQDKAQFKILKRRPDPSNEGETNHNTHDHAGMTEELSSLSMLTFEEREAKYQEARERIFKDFKGDSEESVSAVDKLAVIKTTDTVTEVEVEIEGEDVTENSKETTAAAVDSRILEKKDGDVISNDSEVTANIPAVTGNLMKLNPNANPFNFIPSSPLDQDDVIEINHIFTVKPADPNGSPLDLTDLKEILDSCFKDIEHFKGFIKVYSLPTTFAFLLTTTTPVLTRTTNQKWIIEKWQPRFYSE